MKIHKKISDYNNQSRYGYSIEYIVIHYVGAVSTAKNNADYFYGGDRQASAHYFVDEDEIWQSVEEDRAAWHCGGPLQGSHGHTFFQICTNLNSIGIEMCVIRKNGKYIVKNGTIENTAWLVQKLMDKYNIPKNRVIRHFDVTGKDCPAAYPEYDTDDYLLNKSAWKKFRKKLVGSSSSSKPVKASIFSISGDNAPSQIIKGQPFVIKGTIKSNIDLRWVEVGAYDTSKKKWVDSCYYKKSGIDGKTYSLTNADPHVTFRKLSIGSYNYRVKATDETGSSKVLVDKKFLVVGKTSKKSYEAIAKEIYNGTCSDKRWASWGNGATRIKRFKEAGYTTSDIKKIQNILNKMF